MWLYEITAPGSSTRAGLGNNLLYLFPLKHFAGERHFNADLSTVKPTGVSIFQSFYLDKIQEILSLAVACRDRDIYSWEWPHRVWLLHWTGSDTHEKMNEWKSGSP